METKASAKYLHGSAQKARLVVDLIRGKNVNEALALLQFTNKRAAHHVEACVRSAVANATEAAEKANIAIDPDDLWVRGAFVDQGPTKKRYRMRPAPQGRAYRERRHFCHVTVLLSSDAKEEKQTAKRGRNGRSDTASTSGKSSRAASLKADNRSVKKEDSASTESAGSEATAKE
ncbi:MAG: 50S ribosomal protein L22 [Pyrinomonadaceae bacterium]|nr:50S ribosomal protein L22 [Pyrinomonadaceae bacterium]